MKTKPIAALLLSASLFASPAYAEDVDITAIWQDLSSWVQTLFAQEEEEVVCYSLECFQDATSVDDGIDIQSMVDDYRSIMQGWQQKLDNPLAATETADSEELAAMKEKLAELRGMGGTFGDIWSSAEEQAEPAWYSPITDSLGDWFYQAMDALGLGEIVGEAKDNASSALGALWQQVDPETREQLEFFMEQYGDIEGKLEDMERAIEKRQQALDSI